MSSSVMISFNNLSSEIEILYDDQNQPWFKRAHVGKFLGIASIKDSMKQIPEIDMKSRGELWGMSTIPLEANQNSTDIFLSEDGIIYVIINSKKSKCKELTKWLINQGIKDIIEEKRLAITEKDIQHRLAIEDMGREHQQVIEEKDDEIQNLVRNRHVPRIGKHDNILCAIDKNAPEETGKPGRHPYYMIRCQQMRLQERLHIKQLQYPNMVIKRPTYDAANAVICWVAFQKYIGKDSYYRNHFSLDNDDHRDFFANTFDIDM